MSSFKQVFRSEKPATGGDLALPAAVQEGPSNLSIQLFI